MPPTTRNFANWATSGRMPAGAARSLTFISALRVSV